MLIKKIYFSIYKLFSHIVCVSKADQNYLLENHVIQKENSSVADFRVNRIQDRISNANQKLQSTFRWWGNLKSFSSSYRQSLMLGNFWIDEIDSLSMDPLLNRVFKGELLIGITPHELSNDQLNKIKAWFQSKKIPVFEVSVADSDRDLKELFEQVQREKGVLLFNIKGFLCELYSAFQLAYVGGGFRDSVHSLLEPYLAGCQVLTGPKIHKSSEYDFIVESSPERIQLLTKFSWESILECRHGSAINFSSNYSQTEKIMKELLI